MKKLAGKWLAAISGGPDSMALVDMCREKGMDIAAAHVNYHHRQQAEEEERYVRSYCRKYQIPCFVRDDPFVWNGNFEACAREWRYDFFAELVKKWNFDGVLIAHQEDDLLETYFMQKEKNLVPAWYGLKEENLYHGILVKRPLLKYTKQDLLQYCIDHKVKYYIDETNTDTSLSRNRTRLTLVSKMSRAERDAVLAEIEEKNTEKTERRDSVLSLMQDHRVSLDEYRKLEEEDRLCLLRLVIEPEEAQAKDKVTRKHLQEMDAVLMKQRDFVLPVHGEILVQKDGFFFMHAEIKPYTFIYHNAEELQAEVNKEYDLHPCFSIEPGKPSVYAVTLKEEDFPVTIRNFRKGDQISLRFGTKKAARFFVDRKIPRFLRSGWPVVINSGNEVILVPGIGCDKGHFSDRPVCNVVQYPQYKGDF